MSSHHKLHRQTPTGLFAKPITGNTQRHSQEAADHTGAVLRLGRLVGNRGMGRLLQRSVTITSAEEPHEPASVGGQVVQRMTTAEALNLHLQQYGIRSASTPTDLNGAAFALLPVGYDPIALVTGTTYSTTTLLDQLLATCNFILNYPGAEGNHLILLKAGSPATGTGYDGTLDKFNSAANSKIITTTPLAGHTAEELRDWIVGNFSQLKNLTPDDDDDSSSTSSTTGASSESINSEDELLL